MIRTRCRRTHLVAEERAHAADLAVQALRQHDAEGRGADAPHFARLGDRAEDAHAARHAVEKDLGHRPVDRDDVFLLVLVLAAQDLVDDVAVVGQQDQPFGVLVEPADRKDALAGSSRSRAMLPATCALGGAGDADRLVERDVDVLLRAADRLAVDADDVACRDLRAERRDDAVDGDAPGFDARVRLAPRAQAGLADVLVQSQTLRRRNELIVALMLALELQEIVVAADLAVRIAPAHVRPRLVDGAAALVGVEEAADRSCRCDPAGAAGSARRPPCVR